MTVVDSPVSLVMVIRQAGRDLRRIGKCLILFMCRRLCVNAATHINNVRRDGE